MPASLPHSSPQLHCFWRSSSDRAIGCRSARNTPSARDRAKPSGATLRCAPSNLGAASSQPRGNGTFAPPSGATGNSQSGANGELHRRHSAAQSRRGHCAERTAGSVPHLASQRHARNRAGPPQHPLDQVRWSQGILIVARRFLISAMSTEVSCRPRGRSMSSFTSSREGSDRVAEVLLPYDGQHHTTWASTKRGRR